MERTNLHATALIVGAEGVLILGPSGSGKSSLAVRLIELSHARSGFAMLVADDQLWIERLGNRLVAETPEAIAGLVEIRGFGPARIAHEPRMLVDRVARLVDPADAPRYRFGGSEELLGVTVPRIDLAQRDSAGASIAIEAWLGTATD